MAQGGAASTNSLSEVAMAIFVLLLIVLLLVELPNWVVNVSICLNITLGVVLLMISLYVKKTLELAAFPSIILIGTMFRWCYQLHRPVLFSQRVMPVKLFTHSELSLQAGI